MENHNSIQNISVPKQRLRNSVDMVSLTQLLAPPLISLSSSFKKHNDIILEYNYHNRFQCTIMIYFVDVSVISLSINSTTVGGGGGGGTMIRFMMRLPDLGCGFAFNRRCISFRIE